MGYTNTIEMLKHARKNDYAIGAYNIFNLETIKATINAAKEMDVPVILQASESVVKYAGAKNLANMVKEEAKNIKTSVALHLDHGKDYNIICECIDAGFSSVMIDASSLPFDENVKLTKRVVKLAHRHKVSVEAELGELVGVEDNISSNVAHLTDPNKANEFIKLTGADSLAVSIGTAHGINKGTSTPKIHYEILYEIKKLIPKDYPLVCHGASSVDDDLKNKFLSTGGVLKKAQGILLSDLKKLAVTTPICKINVDTDLRLVYTSTLRDSLHKKPEVFNPRDHMNVVMDALKDRIIFTSTQIFK